MQTFLPFPDFARSAAALDNARLGNQCYREALTLYRGGWPRHPAARMWAGHRGSLALYGLACAKEMFARWRAALAQSGRPPWQDAVVSRWLSFWAAAALAERRLDAPPWLGDERLHGSHRSALIRKDPGRYRDTLGWQDRDDLPYFWP